jgi:hypothetical protein
MLGLKDIIVRVEKSSTHWLLKRKRTVGVHRPLCWVVVPPPAAAATVAISLSRIPPAAHGGMMLLPWLTPHHLCRFLPL